MKILSFICLFIPFIAFGQEYQIVWKESKGSVKNKAKVIFDGVYYTSTHQALYTLEISGKALEQVQVVPILTESLTNPENYFLPNEIVQPKSWVSIYKGMPISFVEFSPLIKNSLGGYDKILSYKLIYKEYQHVEPSRTLIKNQSSNRSARTTATSGSVLSSGQWFKFPIDKDGLYKLDYAYFQSMGLNPASINPANIRLFGNGGGMLPQRNADARYDDLQENAIEFVGGQDGRFDPEDYVIFYGRGPHTWELNTTSNLFEHTYNVYSDKAYYFLTVTNGNGLRVSTINTLGGASQSFTTFDDRMFFEESNVNYVASGREWVGVPFDNAVNNLYTLTIPWAGSVSNTNLVVRSRILSKSTVTSSMTVSLNDVNIGAYGLPAISGAYLSPIGAFSLNQLTVNTSSLGSFLNAQLKYKFTSNGSAQCNFDYVELNGKKNLAIYNGQTLFRATASINTSISEYRIQTTNNAVQVWNISSLTPDRISGTFTGSEYVFSDNSSSLNEYVTFDYSNFFTPGAAVSVSPQNLHAYNAPSLPDMIIVTHVSLKSEANRLAQFRKSNDGLDVIVVTTEEVYNEFSSGAQDVTAIRDFVKMLYDRKTATDSIRYLLLFGDCIYDYKGIITATSSGAQLVPIYQSRNSIEELSSYSSDDYYGFMDNSEGNWGEAPVEDHLMDIGVGRIPATNLDQATVMVNKIINYHSNTNSQGKWRNNVTFFSDDGDNNTHANDADFMASTLISNNKNYNPKKIYLDAYKQEVSAGGQKAPLMTEAINNAIANGALVVNYSGHGGVDSWGQENYLQYDQIMSWSNINELPLFITATCDFGRFDHFMSSGADAVLFNPNGGAIAQVSSTRIVFQFSNRNLNEKLIKFLFTPYSTDALPRMGDVFKQTKNNSLNGVNNRNYSYLGDPSMVLNFPKNKVGITAINGIPVSAIADTIKALQKVTLEGEVRTQNNAFMSNFNGVAYITCFDKETNMLTLGEENPPFAYQSLNNFFFQGKATVTNGRFKVTFVAPKDILFNYGQGKISVYASSPSSPIDAGGFYDNVQVGGVNKNAGTDNTPPLVQLYMNDESFVSGGLTNNNPLFIAKVSDENGINTGTSGVGHEITSYLSTKTEPYILNDYYSAELDDYTKGVIRYPIKNLTTGNYAMRFKVYDTYNNESEAYLEFVVANNEKLALDHVLNYPNPFSTHTDFHFDHNRAGDDIEVLIQVYTVTGKMIKSFDQVFYNSPSHISGIYWNGKDDYEDNIGKGVYVYKVKVRSLRDGSTVHQYQKLVLLN
jgi:hypothetical protein